MITNPSAAHRLVDDYSTGLDNDGGFLYAGEQTTDEAVAGAAILEGQALMYTAPTTTATLTVEPMTAAVTGADSWRFAGVALADCAAGQVVQMCKAGPCIALFDSAATPAAAYDLVAAPGTTTGEFNAAGALADNGVYVGYTLGTEIGTTDKALIMLGAPIVRFEAGA